MPASTGRARSAAPNDVGLHQGGSTLAGWYDDMELLTAHSRRLRAVSGYVTINPVRPELLGRCNDRLVDIGAQAQERLAAPDDRPRGYLRSDRSPPQKAARPRKAAISEVEPAGRKATDSTRADHCVADPPHAPDSPLPSRGAGG